MAKGSSNNKKDSLAFVGTNFWIPQQQQQQHSPTRSLTRNFKNNGQQPKQQFGSMIIPSSVIRTTSSSLSLSSSSSSLQAISSSSSSFGNYNNIFIADATTTDVGGDVVSFEPIMPPTETLVGMGVIVLLCVVVSWVWANQVVPVSRTKLAIDKSRGELKEYLEELKASDPANYNNNNNNNNNNNKRMIPQNEMALMEDTTTTTTITATITAVDNDEDSNRNEQPMNDWSDQQSATTTSSSSSSSSTTKTIVSDNRALERWLFTDWLRDNKSATRRAGRQKEPALPILKNAKWNSGDNPVLVASALIGLGVVFSAIVEKIFS